MATLRASPKRGTPGTVGRFGVGFAAVLALTDEPVVASGAAAVEFSGARTRALLAGVPALAEVLRLPFAVRSLRPP